MTKPSKKEIGKLKQVNKKPAAPAKKAAAPKKTSRQEHLEVAKAAYKHLHEEKPVADEKFSEPEKVKATKAPVVDPMPPSIPVHSVAVAPSSPPTIKDLTPIPSEIPATKEGKLKWSDLKKRLPGT